MLSISAIKDLDYSPKPLDSRDPERELDIYSPSTNNESLPVILFVHGGAWRTGDKSEHMQLAERLSQQGFVVVVNNYRLSHKSENNGPPIIQHPSHIKDTMDAVRYIQSRYEGRKLFLVGHSAGAHIILSIALKPEFQLTGIDGYIGVEGIYDIPLLLKTFPDYLDFIQQAFTDNQAEYSKASLIGFTPAPIHSPIALLYSPEDELIDPGQHESIYSWLKFHDIVATVKANLHGKHDECLTTSEMTDAIGDFVRNQL
ncbi:Alpha/Beta hydrolase protein [Umbelopsis sp. AD052]|nr:Alpha/Beta hydrolase protein [Umbelopsis sp. AD052]